MPRYPLLSEPLPEGLTTLRRWAPAINRSPSYIEAFWRPMPGFPSPVGELPSRARNGGGPGELVYAEGELVAFRAANPSTWPERTRQQLTVDADTQVTRAGFAAIAGVAPETLARYQDKPGFPPAGPDGKYRLGDLIASWNQHLADLGGQLLDLGGLGEIRVTFAGFAAIAGVRPQTVYQYQDEPGFPPAGPDGKYRLGDLVGFWNDRPGKRGPARAGQAKTQAVA